MEENEKLTRARISIKTTAKGEATFDITAESESVTESRKMLRDAIDAVRDTCAQKNLKLAGE